MAPYIVSDARQDILERIRHALADVPASECPEDVPVPREYRRQPVELEPLGVLIELFVQRLRDYGAEVVQCGPAEVTARVGAACERHGLTQLAIPSELPSGWLPAGIEIIPDTGLRPQELDQIGAALTGCTIAVVETGTLVLDGGPRCGRRALTLVPDHHICVVEIEQLVLLVPQALAAITPAAVEQRQPITLISGPSASSDIELSRVEGVHGPRDLIVVIIVQQPG